MKLIVHETCWFAADDLSCFSCRDGRPGGGYGGGGGGYERRGGYGGTSTHPQQLWLAHSQRCYRSCRTSGLLQGQAALVCCHVGLQVVILWSWQPWAHAMSVIGASNDELCLNRAYLFNFVSASSPFASG